VEALLGAGILTGMLLVEQPIVGPAADFHGREVPVGEHVRLWWFEPLAPALVLGSTQSEDMVDLDACRRRGIDVVKRRSGGGLVLVSARHTLWADVIVPSTDRVWRSDVGRASEWIGEVWMRTFEHPRSGVDASSFTLHRGAQVSTPWSRSVCFAGRGPGEIFDASGRKVVGISQRRTRDWARFQCAVSLVWEPELFVDLLLDGPPISDIEKAGHSFDSSLDVDSIRAAFTDSLASAVVTSAV
jgi:lipoate-protein ligase A